MLRSSVQEHKFVENTAYTTFTATSCGLPKRLCVCKVSTQEERSPTASILRQPQAVLLQVHFASRCRGPTDVPIGDVSAFGICQYTSYLDDVSFSFIFF